MNQRRVDYHPGELEEHLEDLVNFAKKIAMRSFLHQCYAKYGNYPLDARKFPLRDSDRKFENDDEMLKWFTNQYSQMIPLSEKV